MCRRLNVHICRSVVPGSAGGIWEPGFKLSSTSQASRLSIPATDYVSATKCSHLPQRCLRPCRQPCPRCRSTAYENYRLQFIEAEIFARHNFLFGSPLTTYLFHFECFFSFILGKKNENTTIKMQWLCRTFTYDIVLQSSGRPGSSSWRQSTSTNFLTLQINEIV